MARVPSEIILDIIELTPLTSRYPLLLVSRQFFLLTIPTIYSLSTSFHSYSPKLHPFKLANSASSLREAVAHWLAASREVRKSAERWITGVAQPGTCFIPSSHPEAYTITDGVAYILERCENGTRSLRKATLRRGLEEGAVIRAQLVYRFTSNTVNSWKPLGRGHVGVCDGAQPVIHILKNEGGGGPVSKLHEADLCEKDVFHCMETLEEKLCVVFEREGVLFATVYDWQEGRRLARICLEPKLETTEDEALKFSIYLPHPTLLMWESRKTNQWMYFPIRCQVQDQIGTGIIIQPAGRPMSRNPYVPYSRRLAELDPSITPAVREGKIQPGGFCGSTWIPPPFYPKELSSFNYDSLVHSNPYCLFGYSNTNSYRVIVTRRRPKTNSRRRGSWEAPSIWETSPILVNRLLRNRPKNVDVTQAHWIEAPPPCGVNTLLELEPGQQVLDGATVMIRIIDERVIEAVTQTEDIQLEVGGTWLGCSIPGGIQCFEF